MMKPLVTDIKIAIFFNNIPIKLQRFNVPNFSNKLIIPNIIILYMILIYFSLALNNIFKLKTILSDYNDLIAWEKEYSIYLYSPSF